jgi:hypothetical protein
MDEKFYILHTNKGLYPCLISDKNAAEFESYIKSIIGIKPIKDDLYQKYFYVYPFYPSKRGLLDCFDGYIVKMIE